MMKWCDHAHQCVMGVMFRRNGKIDTSKPLLETVIAAASFVEVSSVQKRMYEKFNSIKNFELTNSDVPEPIVRFMDNVYKTANAICFGEHGTANGKISVGRLVSFLVTVDDDGTPYRYEYLEMSDSNPCYEDVVLLAKLITEYPEEMYADEARFPFSRIPLNLAVSVYCYMNPAANCEQAFDILRGCIKEGYDYNYFNNQHTRYYDCANLELESCADICSRLNAEEYIDDLIKNKLYGAALYCLVDYPELLEKFDDKVFTRMCEYMGVKFMSELINTIAEGTKQQGGYKQAFVRRIVNFLIDNQYTGKHSLFSNTAFVKYPEIMADIIKPYLMNRNKYIKIKDTLNQNSIAALLNAMWSMNHKDLDYTLGVLSGHLTSKSAIQKYIKDKRLKDYLAIKL